VFPHSRALNYAAAPEELHEERRLAYVGFTRARKRLFLSAARARSLFGEFKFNPPSRFLLDVPEALVEQSPWRALGQPQTTERGSSGYSIDRSYDQTWDSSHSGASRPRYTSGRGQARPGRSVESWNAAKRVATIARVESLDWPNGLVVVHPTFGLGKIMDADGNGPDAKLTVRFGATGDKRIVARFIKRAE
jgi:DNA helicase-2/ATP-dependent DNA helicase PcrA